MTVQLDQANNAIVKIKEVEDIVHMLAMSAIRLE